MYALLQNHTKELIDRLLERPPHAILFSGPEGAGKLHAAKYFAFQKLNLGSIQNLSNHPYFKIISPDKNTLSISQIRELQKFLQLKTPGKDGIRRIVIIENAQYMTLEAQNALLKTLEEPPADTIIILTAPATLRLKQTIYSRVQNVPVLPVSKSQAKTYFATYSSADIDKAFVMSGGQAGLLYALLNDKDHALVAEIQNAKRIISSSRFDRLISVDEISKQKELIPRFLQACKIICIAALGNAASKNDAKLLNRWHKSLELVYKAESALPNNPNSKLLLTNLMIQL